MKTTKISKILSNLRIKQALVREDKIRKAIIYTLLFGIICLAFAAGYLAVKLEKMEEINTKLERAN